MNRRCSVAPMLGWTDRHARYFHRRLSPHLLLYSEMLAPEAILLGRRQRFLACHPQEQPVAFQLGGSQPQRLAQAAQVLEAEGFAEVNFNVGCPSPKGKHRLFGAHLMQRPELVAECVRAMCQAVAIPVTVKTRIGVDHLDSYQFLADFVGQVQQAGCRTFIIHARKAWLEGLSPRANRTVPPLDYARVYRLKRDFPELTIVLNGGIEDWEQARAHLEQVDGIMIGRKAYKEPHWLSQVERELFGSTTPQPSAAQILWDCLPYVESELAQGSYLRDLMRPMVGLYRQSPAASAFRRHIALEAHSASADLAVYRQAIAIAEALERRRPCEVAH